MAHDLLSRLRQRQWRLSPQRRAVAEVLVGEHVHLTAEEVHALAQRRLPEISRATVYNTLNELVAMGELGELDITDGAKRYDPNIADAHDHLVCERCHAIRDVPRNGNPPSVPKRARAGFLVTGVDVTYRGVCPSCAVTSPRRTRRGSSTTDTAGFGGSRRASPPTPPGARAR